MREGRLVVEPDLSQAGVVAHLTENALSDLVQDYQAPPASRRQPFGGHANGGGRSLRCVD